MSSSPTSPHPSRLPTAFLATIGGLLLAFAWPLTQLARFAWTSSLYSHLVLIPVVSVGMAWMRRSEWRLAPPTLRPLALVPLLAGVGLLGGFALGAGWRWPEVDRLAATTAAFVLGVWTVCLVFLDRAALRAAAFPLGFLVFLIPLPSAAIAAVEAFLQLGSATAARGLFALTGPLHFYHDLVFEFPGGFSMQVAPECSGIRSSLVLFITSVVAGQLFLHSRWKRAALTVFVIPLALLRNGLRVFVIGQLCVRVGPEMIHSWIHRQGGPVFFLLSLVPFLLLLWFLARSERGRNQAARGKGQGASDREMPCAPRDEEKRDV